MFKKSLTIAFAFFFALFFMCAKEASAQEFVTDGLVAFYTLDKADIDGEKVLDMSGNGNDAKIIGSLKSVKGKIDECLQFEGKVDNYVEIPPMGSWEQASVECWALRSEFDGTSQGIVSTFGWEAGKVHFKFQKDQNITVDKNDGDKIGEAFIFDVNTWYHIIYTCDTEANELKLYINGEFVDEGASGGTPQNMDERRIGSEFDGRWLTGMVDEVRIYDRILSEDEILKNSKATSNTLAVEAEDKLAIIWASIKSER